ncbi:MAG: hypothetical protein ABIR96_11100, partial [Bdellovibrionota bacterium]
MRGLLPESRRLRELRIGVFPTKSDIKVLDRELVLADGKALDQLTKNPDLEMSYVIGPDDRLYLVNGAIDLDTDHPWMADALRDDGTPWSFPIKEAGAVRFARDTPGKTT